MNSKKKIVAMIPARLGSQRVKKKNIRLINGKPLISYIIETAIESNVFDEIYVNSESKIFKEIADQYRISFYHRSSTFSTNESTNDDFGLDFINNVDGDILVQLLPTSPLLSKDEVVSFVNKMVSDNYDTLISVEEKQIACMFNGKELNFEKIKQNPPSQEMKPILAYATALMSWSYDSFKNNMKTYGSAYHGGDGKTGYFTLRGLSTIDIDREEDFVLAESLIKSISSQGLNSAPQYYGNEGYNHVEVDVPLILEKDGVVHNDLLDSNKELVSIFEIVKNKPRNESWSKRVVDTENNSMTIIAQMPGEGNRRHFHPDWNEWWYIYQGEWLWEIEGIEKKVKKGDIVFMEKNRIHKITASGNNLAIRFAVSRSDVEHVFTDKQTGNQ